MNHKSCSPCFHKIRGVINLVLFEEYLECWNTAPINKSCWKNNSVSLNVGIYYSSSWNNYDHVFSQEINFNSSNVTFSNFI
jgi:hypothetical protein